MTTRRAFLRGLAGCFAAAAAPAVVGQGILMPTRQIVRPTWFGMDFGVEDISISIKEYAERCPISDLEEEMRNHLIDAVRYGHSYGEIGYINGKVHLCRVNPNEQWMRDAELYRRIRPPTKAEIDRIIRVMAPKPPRDYIGFVHPGWLFEG